MQILLAGFEDGEMDRLSQRIQEGGHAALGATGPASASSLLKAASPVWVLVPPGSAGEEARGWVLGDVAEERVLAISEDEDPLETLQEDTVDTPEPVVSTSTSLAPSRPAPPASAPVTRPPTGPVTRPISPEEQLDEKLQQVRFGSYHQVLEVESAETAYGIRQQYEELSARFRPQGWPAPVGPQDVVVLDEIAQGLQEAYSILGTPELRASYEAALARAAAEATAQT
jgi:hypothetical protein